MQKLTLPAGREPTEDEVEAALAIPCSTRRSSHGSGARKR